MTITVPFDNEPLGNYTWVVVLRDGTTIEEYVEGKQQSFDIVKGLDVFHVHLIPFRNIGSYIQIVCQPGEYVTKCWTRTFTHGSEVVEHPVIDVFSLVSEKPVYHLVYADGGILVTTDRDNA